MKKDYIEEKYILEYIKDFLNDLKIKEIEIKDAKYHHNSRYVDGTSILKHGILSINDLNKNKITNYNENLLKIMSDTDSHINGLDKVSLSITGLKDISKESTEYNPYAPYLIDFLIDSKIPAERIQNHYYNEFIADSIDSKYIKSMDVRLLDLINKYENNPKYFVTIDRIIKKYNKLQEFAKTIKELELDIPLREMSNNENISLDIDNLSKTPKLILKK